MPIAARPCEPWPATLCCSGLPEDVSDVVLDQALRVSTEILWGLSGRRFGTCEVTMRPCRKECSLGLDVPWWGDYLALPAQWWAWQPRCSSCQRTCGCSRLEEIRLPLGPVVSVGSVIINGEVLPASGASRAYRVDDFRTLVRLDGGTWPWCQDLLADITEPNTFQVTWTYGRPVPAAGLLAVSILACEVAKACLDLPCELPDRLQHLVRQGLSMAFLDPQDFLEQGRTGLYLPDLFLRTYNPHKLQRRARVHRADDDRRPWRRVDTG